MRRIRPALLAFAVALGAPAPSAFAAVDVFLCVPEVTGTCAVNSGPDSDWRARGWLRASAVAFGAHNEAPSTDPYAPGAASLGAVEAIKSIDDLSPTFFLSALQGGSIDVHLAWRRAGGTVSTTKPYLVIEYVGVTLTVSQFQLSGDESPGERLTFEGADGVTASYWKQKADGTLLSPPIVTTWTAP